MKRYTQQVGGGYNSLTMSQHEDIGGGRVEGRPGRGGSPQGESGMSAVRTFLRGDATAVRVLQDGLEHICQDATPG